MVDQKLSVERGEERIRFLLNGDPIEIDCIKPTHTVLQYLREHRRLTGTKEGCAEGDCGACTVVIGEVRDDYLVLKAVNACIQFMPTLDGKALFTVEYLRQADGKLHPVQQAMVEYHGSQCGFCTPGFIMSLWSVYNQHVRSNSRPGDSELRTALSGNLCRCTGYRPILDAGKAMFDLSPVSFAETGIRKKLTKLKRDRALSYRIGDAGFHAPKTLSELVNLRVALPKATILAGGTDVGLWVNKQFRDLGEIIYVGEVAELQEIQCDGDTIRIGASVSLTDAYATLVKHYPEATEMGERFASVPIRNAGTLGGNIANGSPIGDSMPWLIVVGAKVIMRGPKGSRAVPLDAFYLDYMQKDMAEDEIVEAIEIPLPAPNQIFRTYKVAKRFDSDISAVCAAFSLFLEDDKIVDARIAFGGMSATPKRTQRCEQVFLGKPWNEAVVNDAAKALADDFHPLSDLRASAGYRLRVAENLIRRFYFETREDRPLPDADLSVFAFHG
jgi:xanthine dehydrogenase small subunit